MSALAAVIWDWWWLLALGGALALLWVVLRWHDTTPDPTTTAPEGPPAEPAPAGPTADEVAAAALTPDDPALPEADPADRRIAAAVDDLIDRRAYWLIACTDGASADALGRLSLDAYGALDGLTRDELHRALAVTVGPRVARRAAQLMAATRAADPSHFTTTTERTDR